MFWFLLISLAVVVAAVTLAVVGSGGDGDGRGGGAAVGGLVDAPPDLLDEPLPVDRPVSRADVDGLRLPVSARGYRMQQVDDILDRLGAELAERDARIAELESALAGAQATAMGRTGTGAHGGYGEHGGYGSHGGYGTYGGAQGDGVTDPGERHDER